MGTVLASSLTPQQWAIGVLALTAWLLPARWRRKRRSRPSLYRRVLWYPNARRRRDFTAEQRATMYARDGGRCHYCGVLVHYEMNCQWVDGCDTCFEADHVVPWSRGGETVLSNGVTACRFHNRLKSDRSLDEFMAGAPR